MNIAIVETYPLLHRLNPPYGDANGYKKYRTLFLIRIVTESGIDGWGECIDWLPALQVGFRERIIPYVIGKSALQRSELTRTIGKWHQRAAAAVSMALSEITAKMSGMHICELWGGRTRNEVPIYASFQSYTEDSNWQKKSMENIGKAWDEGFRMIKVKIGGRAFCDDKQHIVSIQSSFGGKLKLILDANQSYDAAFVRKWIPLFNCWSNLLWLEEPIPFHLIEEYRLLRLTMPVPLAGGENMKGAADFIPLLNERALDIIQPDPMHHPDIDSYRESLSLARQFGFRVSPHCYDGGLSRLYAIYAQACLTPWTKMGGESIEPVEWDCMDNPFTHIFSLQHNLGTVHVPSGIGIGVEPDMSLIRAYRWDGQSYEQG